MRHSIVATAIAILVPSTAAAATVPAAGYLYQREVLPELTEACIAHAPGGVFVAVGAPLAFPTPMGGTRSILFVSDGGAVRTVATGLNSVGDCAYDAAADVLYVTDSGQEFSGAVTGDTVFAIPGDATNLPVAGLEVLPAGSIAYAFSVSLFGDGLLVSDAAGDGLGSVLEIDLAGMTPSASTFASGFDYTGGVVVDGDRVLVAEAVQPSFESRFNEYTPAGVFVSTVSGPTYDHGSIDLDIALDGGVLVSGAPTLASVDEGGVVSPLVSGLDGGTDFDAFGGGISVQDFTGRIDFLASSFSGDDDDKSVHRLVPIDRLVPGGGSTASDCTVEFYGLELVAPSPTRPARSAICVDGAACDADGAADGACTFPLGLCLNVDDPRLADCTPSSVGTLELRRARPESAELTALVAEAASLLPT
ncbi:MAG: hypothetical protein ABR538_18335, partial [Candidatus Binatia bacterium]